MSRRCNIVFTSDKILIYLINAHASVIIITTINKNWNIYTDTGFFHKRQAKLIFLVVMLRFILLLFWIQVVRGSGTWLMCV